MQNKIKIETASDYELYLRNNYIDMREGEAKERIIQLMLVSFQEGVKFQQGDLHVELT